jgi:N utilization substance protein B
MKSRTKARFVALQTLYEVDLTDHPMGAVLADRAEEQGLDQALYAFAQLLVNGVLENAKNLDQAIAAHAPEWPLDQVAVIDRNILRLALWEVAVYKKTPLKVGINEAVELAKAFGTDSSPRFINGVLGSLAENMEKVSNAIAKG